MASRPQLLVVCAAIGQPSEPWLWRQIAGIKRLKVDVACWSHTDREVYHTPDVTTHVLDHSVQPMYGPGRWWLRLRNAPSGNFYGTVGAERKQLAALVRMEQARVMLCHFGHYALRVLPVALTSKVPLVAHFHGLDMSSALKQDRWYRWSLLKNLRKFAAIVVVGKHQEDWMLAHGVERERLHLIPCGAPVRDYCANHPSRGERLRFITVSRLVPWKGVDLTIRAFAQAAATIQDSELLIVGDGPERGTLEGLAASLGLTSRIIFAGACASDQVRTLYESSDVFVQHSVTHSSGWVEGFGVTLVEAAAAGLPVVVSRSGGIGPQVLEGKTGFLVEERDIAAMAQFMTRVAEDGELRMRMGREGRRHVERHFNSTNQIEKLEHVLLSAIN